MEEPLSIIPLAILGILVLAGIIYAAWHEWSIHRNHKKRMRGEK